MSRKGFLWLALSTFLLMILGATPEDASPVNTIRAIRSVPRGVEIEVHSTRPFPVRTLPPVLRVGEAQFLRSRYPRGGTLDTLVFLLSAEEFDALLPGDEVFVQYGKADAAAARAKTTWAFGRLDKTLRGGP